MSNWKNELNYHTWSKFRVDKREQIPAGPHFQAMVFTTRTEYTPAYDQHDRDSSHSVPHIDHYVFTKREDLDKFVSDASQSTTKFVFFAVPSLGKATVHVDVKMELSDVDDGTNPMQAFGHGRGK